MSKFILTLALVYHVSVYAQVTFKGIVKTSDGPLENALVMVDQRLGTVSDLAGNFILENLLPGNYTIQVSHLGFRTIEKTIQLKRDEEFSFVLLPSINLVEEIVIQGTRAGSNQLISRSNISKAEIEKQNNGQDLPFLLRRVPSLIATSDAGAGVGYTGLRIRGSDATRINVTINGVALNDAESHGVFWVNLPDFASSVENIQIQRGVGTSTSGTAGFGASISLLTENVIDKATASISNSYGSFNTWKNSMEVSSGMLNNRFAFGGRFSNISSDGYIDRATSDLQSFYAQGAYMGANTIIKAILFGGKEVTYQSWWGVPEAKLQGDDEALEVHILNNGYSNEEAENLRDSDNRTYNYYTYDNQVDDYQQNHSQLHWIQKISNRWQLNSVLHYTKGQGFFEEFKDNDLLSNYGVYDISIGDTTIFNSDIIRRRWLDNDFFGINSTLHYYSKSIDIITGLTANQYNGEHFGKIKWSEWALATPTGYQYYFSEATKKEFSVFTKLNLELNQKLNLFIDIQERFLDYSSLGSDNDLRIIDFSENYSFFNPKGGLNFQLNNNLSSYLSVAIANREPIRSDFTDAFEQNYPKPEKLIDYEIGIRRITESYSANVNVYFMDYKNQLVLTGNVNDVGAPIRTNMDNSYRSGIEMELSYQINPHFSLYTSATISENKIEDYIETVVDYGNGVVLEIGEKRDRDISFSPSLIWNTELVYMHNKNLQISWYAKYVGDQYLDNSSNENRKLDAYFRNDFQLSYQIENKYFNHALIKFQVNNVLDELYSSNGYSYSYVYGELITENFYYPQAGRHFFIGLDLNF